MMVPTLTMLGRSWCPCRREAGIARCCRHGVIMSSARRGHPDPRRFGGIQLSRWTQPRSQCRRTRWRTSRASRSGGCSPSWELSPVLAALTVLAVGLYLVGVRSLRGRGDRWPVGRTLVFAASGWAPSTRHASGLAAYDTTLLSVHMVQHMVLSMLVPLALALSAPVTLALRTLRARPRALAAGGAPLAGRRRCCRSRRSRSLLYVVSPWALYFSGWYDASLRVGLHELMHVHLVLVGSLFFWPMWASTRCPGGSATRSGCCWCSSRCRSTRSWASRSWARHADRRRLVPRAARAARGRLAARPARRPAPGRRHAVGVRRPGRAGAVRGAVRAVGALLDAGGRARGPAARPAGGADPGRAGRRAPVASPRE